jgi:predicted ATPase/DNA-binding CsgD family transcriptional regulator
MPAAIQHDATSSDLTSFVGRRPETAETRRLLGTSHLVTLTGPCGVGKTRLALRVAEGLHGSFPEGVWLVELAELRDPSLLANTIADRLGVRDRSARSAVDGLVDHLAPRRLLLLLDNCEQLVESCAPLVDELLRSCPFVRILATSRQSLGVGGEATLHVPPLEPDDAATMFVDRAHAAVPSFRLDERTTAAVARLCRALDGIPLAIELAAVRLRVLPLDQLVDRVDDPYRLLTTGSRSAPARQQTLRAAMDWSYRLCSPEEQLLWARLSVFSGGFDLEATEQVCLGPGPDTGIDADSLLDLVDALVDKSVVVREEYDGRVRYRLLETIREYGQEKLVQAGGEQQMRRRHRDWCDQLTAAFEREWLGPRQVEWVARIRREHANLRVALDYCATTAGEARTGLRMATRLDDYWGIRGLHTEARHWLDGALAAEPHPSRERASGLRLSGWFALLQGEVDPGQQLLAEAAEVARRTGDKAETAYVVQARGIAALFAGDLDTTLLAESLAGFRAAGVPRGELFALFLAGLTLGGKGDAANGRKLVDECLALSEQRDEIFWRSYALCALSYLVAIGPVGGAGEYDRAAAAAREALDYKRRLGDQLGLAFTLDMLAWVSERQGRHQRAAVLFGAAHSIWQSLGASPAYYSTFAGMHDKHVGLVRSALGDDAFDAGFHKGRRMARDAALDYALEEAPADDDGGEAAGADRRPGGSLTRRERQIAELIAEGRTNREIAQTLVIAVRTAEGHAEHILSKLGFTSRAQVAAWVTGRRVREQPPAPT